MKKELLIPITIGIFGGLVVFMGIKIANDAKDQLVSPQTDQNISQPPTNTATPLPTVNNPNNNSLYKLTITQPSQYQLIESDRLILKGATNPNDQIIIIADTDSYYLIANEKGTFDQEIKLTAGYNSITVFSINETNNPQKTDITFISSPPKS